MNIKRNVKKCVCGRVSDPIHLEIVTNTWIKGGFVFFEYDCPQCLRQLTITKVFKE